VKISPTRIPEVLLVEPDVFGDSRGFFMETWNQRKYAEQGLTAGFVQDNHSFSSRGVLRGLHYQLRRPQGKLVRVATGCVFDVAVDIRRGSPGFGNWVGVELSAANRRQLYIPPGFAHGFCVVSDTADFLYKCTDYYDPHDEHGIIWNDPSIGIDWPLADVVVSGKDAANGRLDSMTELLPHYRGAS
jgi:dTDP-4-dehydrorhamnose 3,5-epimerase